MINLFLTGEKRIGKSTIINGLLEEFKLRPSGFKTIRQIVDGKHVGFAMKDLTGIVPVEYSPLYIAKPNSQGYWEPVIDVFDRWGVKILQESIASPMDVILMDELGHFESKAFAFQQQVLECLSAPIPVLGVIKQRSTPFLDSIRQRDDVHLITITKENRNEQYDNIKKILKENLERGCRLKANRC